MGGGEELLELGLKGSAKSGSGGMHTAMSANVFTSLPFNNPQMAVYRVDTGEGGGWNQR